MVEPDYWLKDFSSRRYWYFIYDCLCDLNTALTNLGQPLIIKIGDVYTIIKNLHSEHHIEGIYAHEKTGNIWTFRRDVNVKKYVNLTAFPFMNIRQMALSENSPHVMIGL